MTKCNSVSLTQGCGGCSDRCGWYDDWCCGNSCSGGCGSWNGCGCQNGCASGCGGCLNGCGSCQNGCSCCTGWNSCSGGCGCAVGNGWNGCGCSSSWNGWGCGGCGSCGVDCSCLWPDVPALQSGGVLTPRIIGSGRLCQRVNHLTLCLQDIPECAKTPYALVSVSASGPVDWEFIAQERWRAILRVTIPLTAVIRDCAGCTFPCHSSITVEVPVRITIPTVDLGRAQVTVQPGVRLLCVDGCSEDGCFTVSLAVLVDVYVARWEPNANGDTIPCRPDLPLTLPASFHPCGCCR
ncbi:MAG: hypothetical protein IKK57_12060 [Clostridia bacterium]|nr:hypothetical protein [Clostridia bacterium]